MKTVRPENAATLLDSLADVANREMSAVGVPGLALGVIVGADRASAGLGVTSLVRPGPVAPDTLFRLCSVTKPMTATLAGILAQQGVLDLDAPVSAYLPDLALTAQGLAEQVTAGQLMTHTSGLECELDRDLTTYGRNDDALRRMLVDYRTLRQFAPPGELWGYCNTGYWLLGAVIAQVSGLPYEQAMTEYLFGPAGMSSAVFEAEDAILHPVALPHHRVKGAATEHTPVHSFAFPRPRTPSGGVIASVDDVLHFAAVHLLQTHQGVDASMLTDLQRPVVASFDHAWQSPAWAVERVNGRRTLFHGGSYSGYNSWLSLFPEHAVALAVVTNSSEGRRVIRAIDETLRSSLLGWTPEPAHFVDVSADQLARFAGGYGYPGAGTIDVRVENDGLSIPLPSSTEADGTRTEQLFRPVSDHQFARPDRDRAGADLVFLPDDHNGAMRLRLGNRLGLRTHPIVSPH